ncbi:MAG: hypothetical protein ACR2RE_11245 [Geminicoccaceae bacterium]
MSEVITVILKLLGTIRVLMQLIPSEEERSAIKSIIAKAIAGDLDESDVKDILLSEMRSDGQSIMDEWRKAGSKT